MWQYVRMGVLWTGVCALVRCALKGKSLKAAYPVMTEKVDRILIRKYRYILDDMKVRDAEDQTPNDTGVPKIVWFSWLQGIDQAPDLVKVCLASQRKHLPDYEFRVFDLSNYQQWIELPEYIVRKYKKGLIPAALLSVICSACRSCRSMVVFGWMLRCSVLVLEMRSCRGDGIGLCGVN